MRRLLTTNEEKVMDVFWKEGPLTSIDIAEMNIKSTWSRNYIENIIRSLLKKDMIKECDEKVQYHTQYARQFVAAITKEEYVAKQLSNEITKNSIADFMSALVQEVGDAQKDQEIIQELEGILKQWRESEDENKK